MKTLDDVVSFLRKVVNRVPELMTQIVDEEANRAVEAMRSRFTPYPKDDDDKLNIRTGRLLSSIGRTEVQRKGDEFVVDVGILSSDPLMRGIADTQEYGRKIRVRRAVKLRLTIPISMNLDARGVRIYKNVAEVLASRVYSYLHISRGIIYGVRRSRFDPLFAQRDAVTIPARPFQEPAKQAMINMVAERFQQALQNEL